MVLIYNQKLKPRARELRKNQTPAEALLWEQIRGKKIKNCQFVRQRAIASFIVDFVCLQSKLVIEIDGPIHLQHRNTDTFRQEQLELLGFRVLRFSNKEVEADINSVIGVIAWNLNPTS